MKNFFRTLPGKILLFLLTHLSITVTVGGVLSIFFLRNRNIITIYDIPETESALGQFVLFLLMHRYAILAASILSFALFIPLLLALMSVSARRRGSDEIVTGTFSRFPFDLLLALAAGILALGFAALFSLTWNVRSDNELFAYALLVCLWGDVGIAAALGLCMSAAGRIKARIFLRGTLIWKLCRLIWRGLTLIWRGITGLFRLLWNGIHRITIVWRTALGLLAIVLLTLFLVWGESVFLLILELALLILFVLWVAYTLRRLQKGGEAIASGDLSEPLDTAGMIGDFRRHAENLNSINDGISRAVEQRTRSERMKTELITNVSHDIKTPLTSIINYADLIGKEPCDNPKITEYSAVLLRQSERLKRLIEDLVEASKASTGNLEVDLTPCEIGVLLVQVAGEYAERIHKAGLTLVTSQPEHPVSILADGRRLWRVFDNLMNNACKYAQSGTRVYLSLTEQEGEAIITFRNISRQELNLSPDELMERFVRGDASRSTEGNGLGLSIARSLTELQGGTLTLDIDGDLFKVTLRFPTI